MIAATDDRKRDFDRSAVLRFAVARHTRIPKRRDPGLGSAQCVGRRCRALPIPTVAASTRAPGDGEPVAVAPCRDLNTLPRAWTRMKGLNQ